MTLLRLDLFTVFFTAQCDQVKFGRPPDVDMRNADDTMKMRKIIVKMRKITVKMRKIVVKMRTFIVKMRNNTR